MQHMQVPVTAAAQCAGWGCGRTMSYGGDQMMMMGVECTPNPQTFVVDGERQLGKISLIPSLSP